MIANARKRALLDAMNVFYMICASLRHSTQIWPRTKVKRPAVGSRKHVQGPIRGTTARGILARMWHARLGPGRVRLYAGEKSSETT